MKINDFSNLTISGCLNIFINYYEKYNEITLKWNQYLWQSENKEEYSGNSKTFQLLYESQVKISQNSKMVNN